MKVITPEEVCDGISDGGKSTARVRQDVKIITVGGNWFARILYLGKQRLDEAIRLAVRSRVRLSRDQRVADLDRRQFVLADPAKPDLIGAGIRIESPHTVA